MRNKAKLERIDELFRKELEEAALKNTPISKFKPSIRRITKAIRRHSKWQDIKTDIINTSLDDDRFKNGYE